jgi:threonine/homoserine/homoserine lactone efflux protein
MIDWYLYLAYLVAAGLCIATPGPDSLATLATGASQGRAAGQRFGIGVGAGGLTHTVWAALGISALVAASPKLFAALKLLGALYLLWLGIQAWRSGSPLRMAQGQARSEPGAALFWRGFVSNALNPKVMLFFLAFVPQFVDAEGGPVFAQMLLLGATFSVMTACSYAWLGAAAGRLAAPLMQRPALGIWLNRATGSLFILLALRLLWPDERRA